MQHRNRKLYHSYIYEDIANVAEKRFDILNYAIERPLPRDKNKKFFGLMKDALGRKIMTQFVAPTSKTYSYLIDDSNSDKKAKGIKKCEIKQILKFNDYENCLLNNKILLKSQQRYKCYAHNVYTEGIIKISLSGNDDKILQNFDRIKFYPYGTNAGKLCKTELLEYLNIK